MKPKRIQRQRTKGWKMPANTVYVGRPTIWGNPFTAKDAEWKGEQIQNSTLVLCYEIMLHDTFHLSGKVKQTKQDKELWEAFVAPLRGKNLACFCKAGEPCHADVLLRFANP